MERFLLYSLGFFVGFLLVLQVESKGRISITLIEYKNPKGYDYNSTCCDSSDALCAFDKCDYVFRICVGENKTECNYGEKAVTPNTQANDIIFDSSKNVPLEFSFDKWKGNAFITVRVTDADTGDLETLVDTFDLQLSSNDSRSSSPHMFSLKGTRPNFPTSLQFNVTTSCDPNYYRSDCSVNCVDQVNCDGMYTCDSNGNKICRDGWAGAQCDQVIFGGSADCSKGSKTFLPSLWEGKYTCPNQPAQNIAMNVSLGVDSISTQASFKFAFGSADVTGSYGSFLRTLTLEGETVLSNGSYVKVTFNGQQNNQTDMSGAITINKTDCIINHLNLKEAYDDTCNNQGTCFIYQQAKYCCCNNGRIQNSCTATTTAKPTTSTTFLSTTASKPTTQETTTENPTTMPEKTTTPKTTTTLPTTVLEETTATTEPPTTQHATTTISTSTTRETTTEIMTTEPMTTTESVTTTVTTTTLPTTTMKATTVESTTASTEATTEESTTELITTTHVPTTTSTASTTTSAPTTASTTTSAPSTISTTTSAPTTSTSTTIPTTTTPRPFQPTKTYTLTVTLVKEEIVDSTIIEILQNVWYEANKDLGLNKSSLHVTEVVKNRLYGIIEQIPHRGYEVTVIQYKVNITDKDIKANEPSASLIQSILDQYYSNVLLYQGDPKYLFDISASYSLYVQGPGPKDHQMEQLQQAIFDAFNSSCNGSDCNVLNGTEVSIKMTVEYVGTKGEEVTRVYFYPLHWGNVHTDRIMEPSLEAYRQALGLQGLKLQLYTGDVQDLVRYRFHYQLLIMGNVFDEDLMLFQMAIQQTWESFSSDINSTCSQCNVSIVRKEKYVGDHGKLLTSLVYFVTYHNKMEMPVTQPGPNITMFTTSVNIKDQNNRKYEVYNGDVSYRYNYLYHLLIGGMVDQHDDLNILAALKEAMRQYTPSSLNTVSLSGLTEGYYSSKGEYVTSIVCVIKYDKHLQDARLVTLPTMEWLSQWLQNNYTGHLTLRSGQQYSVYTKANNKQLYLTQSLFSIYVRGYIRTEDKIDMEASLEMAWSAAVLGSNFTVDLIKEIIYMDERTRETVTALLYVLHKNNGHVQVIPAMTREEVRQNVYNISTALFAQMTAPYDVFSITSRLFDVKLHFEVYFTTKIATMELESKVLPQILSSLELRWNDFNYYPNITIHLGFQEKVYLQTTTTVWRLVFFLSSNKMQINPLFATSIAQSVQNFSITGLNKHMYKVYTGQMSSVRYYYGDHFTLTFGSEVSHLDWSMISRDLRKKWCDKLNCNNENVSVVIKDQEKYIDVTGKLYWRLIYFVHHGKLLISSRHYRTVQISNSWNRIYGGTYTIISKVERELYRYSYSFHFYTDLGILYNIDMVHHLEELLLKAWYKMNIVSESCKCLQIIVTPQQHVSTKTGGSIWRFTYFIMDRDQRLIDASVWPSLNTSLVDLSLITSQNIHILTNVDWLYYQYRLHFYSQQKISMSMYSKIEAAMTETWLKENPGYKACGCIHVKIASQEEVIDSNGHSHWLIHYHIKNHGKPMNPATIRPFNWTLFNIDHKFTSSFGQQFHFTWSWNQSKSYVHLTDTGKLHINTWVPPSLYSSFQSWLLQYYREYYHRHNTDTDVSVELTNTSREYIGKDGSSSWKLPFVLKLNGTIVNPPLVNATIFETTFNATAPNGQEYKTVTDKTVTDSKLYFSVHLNNKVSTSVLDKVKEALINAWSQQHPDVDQSSLKVTFGKQEEVVSTHQTGKSAWKLSYTISVNDTKVDTRSTVKLNSTILAPYLNITGPNNVKYEVVKTDSSYVSSSRLFSLYFNSYVSPEDRKTIEEKIAAVWRKQYNSSSDRISVGFLKQKECVNKEGKSVWKWEYVLKMNSTNVRNVAVLPASFQKLQTEISSVKSVTGKKYSIVNSPKNYYEYAKHFSLYVGTKVTHTDIDKFKVKLQQAWHSLGWKGASVDIANQEELVDKQSGKSVWRLAYFVKRNSTIVDSRVTQTLNTSSMPIVKGPRGQYMLLTDLDIKNYLQYQFSGSFSVNTKFGVSDQVRVQQILKEIIQQNLTETTNKVEVKVNRQEDYFMLNGTKGWRTIYFVKLNGQYIPANSLAHLNTDHLEEQLSNLTSPHGIQLRILDKKDLVYSYRNKFSVYFTTKVAREHLAEITTMIHATLDTTDTEYNNCSCLKVEDIKEHQLEEVIDKSGKSYWQLIYFLRKNGTLVESMTHPSLNDSHFNIVLENLIGPKNKAYKVVHMKESELTRLSMMFSFYLNVDIGYKDTRLFEESIKATWIRTKTDIFSKTSLDVTVNRRVPYVDITNRKTVYKVEYTLKKDNSLIDPLELPDLSLNELKKNLTFKGPNMENYEVVSMVDTVDYRWHFQVMVNREIRGTDYVAFSQSIAQYWKSQNRTESSEVKIPFKENLLDKSGNSYWRLVVFVKTTNGYLDSRTHENINMTQLQEFINYTGVNCNHYNLLSKVPTNIRRYSASFSVMLTKTVRTTDLIQVSQSISNVWKDKVFQSSANVSVEIWGQEKYININHGLVTKVVYYLSVDSAIIPSSRVSNVDINSLKVALSSISTPASQQYVVTDSTKVYNYNHQFSFLLTEPVLIPDEKRLEGQLSSTWALNGKEYENLSVKILLQEDFVVVSTGKSVTRLLYSVTRNTTTLSSSEVNNLTSKALKVNLNLTRTGTTQEYKALLYTTTSMSGLTPYADLFYFMVDTRVARQDYLKFEAQLKTAWTTRIGSTQQIQGVQIVKQETVVPESGTQNARLTKLSYSVTSSNKDYRINSQLFKDLNQDSLKRAVNVTSPLRKMYTVSMTTPGYRLSQFFWVLIDRQIYDSDTHNFTSVLGQVIMSTTKASASAKLNFMKTSVDRVVDVSTGNILWQYGYIAAIDGITVDASYQPSITTSSLSNAVDFASPRNETYRFVKSNVVSYKDLFEVQIMGRPSITKNAGMKTSLIKLWKSLNVTQTLDISTVVREEYLESSGKSITSYRYLARSNDTVLYPTVTQAPLYTTLASDLRLTLYQASQHNSQVLYRYTDLYKVYVLSQKWSINTTEIHTALTQAWIKNGYNNLTFDMVNQTEAFVGSLGVTLNAVLYTVRDLSSSQKVTPDVAVEPHTASVQESLTEQGSGITIYSPESQPVFRVQVLFEISLGHTQNEMLNRQDVQILQTLMERGWEHVTNESGYRADFVSKAEYKAVNSSAEISRFYYSVKRQHKNIESWRSTVSTTSVGEALGIFIQQNGNLSNKVSVTSQEATRVHTVFVNGKLSTAEQNQVKISIINSWMAKTQYSDVTVEVLSTEKYVNSQWNDVSKVKYTVTVNGTDADQSGVTAPSHDDLNTELKKVGKSQCSCTANKPRKKYVDGKSSSFNFQSIKSAIKTVWTNKVSEVKSSSISINVKGRSSRGKRAAKADISQPRLVGNDDKDISPLQYTVAIQDQEPDTAFVDPPTENELDQQLSNAGAPPCHCTPKLAGSVTLEGNSGDKDKPRISDAVEDAFIKENPGTRKQDLNTEVDLKNTKDQDGNPVTDVKYKLSLNSGEAVEELKAPTEITWKNSLQNTAGKTLHSRAPVEPEEDESWKIPVAVACGILAFILLILIVCYVIYMRKRSKKENLIKRGDEVNARNSFDKEHFSDAAAMQVYDNPSYDESKGTTFKSV